MLREECTAVSAFMKQKDKLIFQPKMLEKEEQTTPKVRRKKENNKD